MNIDEHKQLDNILCEEVNVKQLQRDIGKTEKGDLALVYIKDVNEYKWLLGEGFVECKNLEAISKLLDQFYYHKE